MSVNVVLALDSSELQRKLRKLTHARFLGDMRTFLVAEAMALLQAAAVGEPHGPTNELSNSKAIVPVKENAKEIKIAAAYLSEHAAPVHEGVFGHQSLLNKYPRFRWYAQALHGFEAGFLERAHARLWSLVSGAAR